MEQATNEGRETGEEQRTALARIGLYRLLSGALVYPTTELYALLGQGVAEAEKLSAYLPPATQTGIHNSLVTLGNTLKSQSPDTLQEDYIRIFGHVPSQACPLYETQYGKLDAFQQSRQLADITGFYRAFGLAISDHAKERPDHIAVELEFMAFLIYKEAYAREHHGAEQVKICRDAQRSFFRDHLGCFAPLFARLLRRQAGTGFYRILADLMEQALAMEADLLQVKPVIFAESDLARTDYVPVGTGLIGGMGDQPDA